MNDAADKDNIDPRGLVEIVLGAGEGDDSPISIRFSNLNMDDSEQRNLVAKLLLAFDALYISMGGDELVFTPAADANSRRMAELVEVVRDAARAGEAMR